MCSQESGTFDASYNDHRYVHRGNGHSRLHPNYDKGRGKSNVRLSARCSIQSAIIVRVAAFVAGARLRQSDSELDAEENSGDDPSHDTVESLARTLKRVRATIVVLHSI